MSSEYVYIPVMAMEFEHKGELKFVTKDGAVIYVPKNVVKDLTFADGLHVLRSWAEKEDGLSY